MFCRKGNARLQKLHWRCVRESRKLQETSQAPGSLAPRTELLRWRPNPLTFPLWGSDRYRGLGSSLRGDELRRIRKLSNQFRARSRFSRKPVPTCEKTTDPAFVRLVEQIGTVRISVLNHQAGQHGPRAKSHRVARPFQSRPLWACDGISSPSRGLLPPLRFMTLSKALKSARACRSVK